MLHTKSQKQADEEPRKHKKTHPEPAACDEMSPLSFRLFVVELLKKVPIQTSNDLHPEAFVVFGWNCNPSSIPEIVLGNQPIQLKLVVLSTDFQSTFDNEIASLQC